MPSSNAFRSVSCELEERTALNTLEARGTLRIALKKAGLDATSVSPEQMRVVLEKVLPGELGSRGIADPTGVCSTLVSLVSGLAASELTETPEAVFQRLGGASRP